jgi:hypothetical protein
MKTIKKVKNIPENSAILDGFGKVHFHDTYRIFARTDKNIVEVAREIMKLPTWVVILFRLRNAIVGFFGLKTGENLGENAGENARENSGENATFPTISQTENEVVQGLADSHLDFRVSFIRDPAAGTILLTTVVHFNNIWGRIYFFPVKPFHKIIIKVLLKRYVKS